jgi:hypothetical protein
MATACRRVLCGVGLACSLVALVVCLALADSGQAVVPPPLAAVQRRLARLGAEEDGDSLVPSFVERRLSRAGRRRRRWQQAEPPPPPPSPVVATVEGGRSGASLAAHCDGFELDPPAECKRPLPCDLRAFDPGPRFNRFVIEGRYGRERRWAENNVDPASRHFQNGVEWWVHRALPPATSEFKQLKGAKRIFIAAYFSYFWIFASHLAGQAARKAASGLGRAWNNNPSLFVAAHGHPGSCIGETSKVYRLLVDADMSCQNSARPLAVPYVVSKPPWLVAAELPQTERTTLLFFRGHLPRSSIDKKNVRRLLMQSLAGQPGVVIEAATSVKNASYQPHEAYLQRMIRSTFCLAPRGDTASSRRVYESMAAGCIPVIIADDLALPFARRLHYDEFSVRVSEREALTHPLRVLQTLREMPAAKVRAMHEALLRARPSFLWHTDPSRPSAVDQILLDLCEG